MNATEKRPKRILVVEDEPSIGEVCWEILSYEGFEVELASNGKVARKMVEAGEFDVILLDVVMPEENGKDFYRWFRANHPQRERTVAFTSGDTLGGEDIIMIDSTPLPFLPKPFTPTELKAFIDGVLNESNR